MSKQRLDWTNVSFLVTAHLLAAFAVVYLAAIHFSWWTVGLGATWLLSCSLSVTAGYHRMFAHRAYAAGGVVRALFLAFGAASVQNSVVRWAADHRLHHARVDREEDPYSIRRGFWWAHIGWVLFRARPSSRTSLVRDLEADPLVRLQHKYYVPLALLVGAGIPAAIGAIWGDAIGAVLVAGFLRLVVQWQATFSVNSIAHTLGKRPYSLRNSGRDSFWTALITLGEGYHNFHHRFQSDYRNGIRWFDFDPTKWMVWTLSRVGLTSDLRRAARERIEAARRTVLAETARVPAPVAPAERPLRVVDAVR